MPVYAYMTGRQVLRATTCELLAGGRKRLIPRERAKGKGRMDLLLMGIREGSGLRRATFHVGRRWLGVVSSIRMELPIFRA